jgi:hypothetical protein
MKAENIRPLRPLTGTSPNLRECPRSPLPHPERSGTPWYFNRLSIPGTPWKPNFKRWSVLCYDWATSRMFAIGYPSPRYRNSVVYTSDKGVAGPAEWAVDLRVVAWALAGLRDCQVSSSQWNLLSSWQSRLRRQNKKKDIPVLFYCYSKTPLRIRGRKQTLCRARTHAQTAVLTVLGAVLKVLQEIVDQRRDRIFVAAA